MPVPELSIIIPLYNKQPFVKDCLQSIQSQTFVNFEVIVINDGSTDGGEAVAKSFETNDSRFRVFDQANHGVSAARNKALTIARGKFIAFVDADDTLEMDMYDILIKNIKSTNADIAVCQVRNIYSKKDWSSKYSNEVVTIDRVDAIKGCLTGPLNWSANNKIYKRETIASVEFVGHVHEDLLFVIKVFRNASHIIYQEAAKYNYIVRSSSTSMQKLNPSQVASIDMIDQILSFVRKNEPEALESAIAVDIVANVSILNLIILSKSTDFGDTYKRITLRLEGYRSCININKELSRKHKYSVALFLANQGLYRLLLRLYCKIFETQAGRRIV